MQKGPLETTIPRGDDVRAPGPTPGHSPGPGHSPSLGPDHNPRHLPVSTPEPEADFMLDEVRIHRIGCYH